MIKNFLPNVYFDYGDLLFKATSHLFFGGNGACVFKYLIQLSFFDFCIFSRLQKEAFNWFF